LHQHSSIALQATKASVSQLDAAQQFGPPTPNAGCVRSAGSWILLLLLRMYIAFLSPFFGGACKFYPSCSNYAREAIERHGARQGTLLALKRLLRCHPFTRGGVDLVPDEVARPVGTHHADFAASGQGKAQ
jgi:putative membrane protein insertion efficiency factor